MTARILTSSSGERKRILALFSVRCLTSRAGFSFIFSLRIPKLYTSESRARADRYMRSISRAKTELSVLEDRLRSLNSELGGYERDIEELKQRLQGVDIKDLAKKAEQYNRLDSEIQEINKRIGDLDRKRKVEVLPEIDKFKKELDRKIKSRPEVEKKRRIV